MVWIPPKGQRATIRARFADLTNNSQQGPRVRSVSNKQRKTITMPSESAVVANGTLPNPTPAKNEQVAEVDIQRAANPKQAETYSPGEEWDRHHIPPRHPQPYVIKRVKRRHHEAYNLLFGSSGSLEECIQILRAHWWPRP
jgi:hypothetical protein